MAARKDPVDDDVEQPAPRAEQPGERAAVWIIARLENIQADPEMSVDARRVLQDLTPPAQKYVGLLLREGPVGHQAAAAALKVKEAAVEGIVQEVRAAIRDILPDDD